MKNHLEPCKMPDWVRFLADNYFRREVTPEYAWANLRLNFPELNDPARCANCGASMQAYIYEFDCLDAALLIAMGNRLQHNLTKGGIFTFANRIHIDDLPIQTSLKKRQTQTAKLGLIAKVKGQRGYWAITSRGFEALAGRPVPCRIKVFRNQIIEHFEDTITINEAIRLHREKVEYALARKRTPQTDHRAEFTDYDPGIWVVYAGVQAGVLV